MPWGEPATWSRPDLRHSTFTPKTITHCGDQWGSPPLVPRLRPGPQTVVGKYTEERGGMLSKLPITSKDQTWESFQQTSHVWVNVATNHAQEKQESGAKPVYTLGLPNGGNRFRVDVAKSSCEKPAPCESSQKGFTGHSVALLECVNFCVHVQQLWVFSEKSQ